MSKENKSTREEINKRIDVVSEMFLQGYSIKEIFVYSTKEKWDITERQVYNYVSKCFKKWEKFSFKNAEQNYLKHIKIRERLYNKSYKLNDFKTCLAIMKDIAELQKLYTLSIEHSGNIGNKPDYSGLSDEKLDKILKERGIIK